MDTELLEVAYNKSPVGRWMWTAKFSSGHLSHGKNMVQWNFRTSADCPCCKGEVKDKEHMIQCQEDSAQQIWEESLKWLKSWLQQEKMDCTLILL